MREEAEDEGRERGAVKKKARDHLDIYHPVPCLVSAREGFRTEE